jgi:hypothetical protein
MYAKGPVVHSVHQHNIPGRVLGEWAGVPSPTSGVGASIHPTCCSTTRLLEYLDLLKGETTKVTRQSANTHDGWGSSTALAHFQNPPTSDPCTPERNSVQLHIIYGTYWEERRRLPFLLSFSDFSWTG